MLARIRTITAAAMLLAAVAAGSASAAVATTEAQADILPWCVYQNLETPEEMGDCFVDYYGYGASSSLPFHPLPDPEDHARDAAGVDSSSSYTVPSTCTETACPSWTYRTGASEDSMPAWVREMPIYEKILAEGAIKDDTTFYQSDAAVVASSRYSDCPFRTVCAWQHAGARGKMFQGSRVNWDYEMELYGLGGKVSAVRNRGRTHHQCGSAYGTRAYDWDMPPKHYTGTMGKYNDRTDNIYIFDGHC